MLVRRGSRLAKRDNGNDDGSAVRPVNAANPLELRQLSRWWMRGDRLNVTKEETTVVTNLYVLWKPSIKLHLGGRKGHSCGGVVAGDRKERTGSGRRTDTRSDKRAHCIREEKQACTIVQGHSLSIGEVQVKQMRPKSGSRCSQSGDWRPSILGLAPCCIQPSCLIVDNSLRSSL